MIARFSVSVILAACVMWPNAVSAQSGSQLEGVVTIGDGFPTPIVPEATSKWQTLTSEPQSSDESLIDPIIRSQSPEEGVQYAGAYAPQSGVDSYGDGSGFQAPVYQPAPLPWERDYDTPFRKFIKEVLPNSYVRVEYLNWNIDDVGAQAIGAPSTLIRNPDVEDPREIQYQAGSFFQAPGSPNPNLVGTSQTLVVPTTESINFESISGLRATWGIPLTFGRLEFSGFALEETESSILDPGFRNPRGMRTLVFDEFQASKFVLASNFVVNQAFNTTTSGTVLAVAQPLTGSAAALLPNIPAGSLVPNPAGFGPPGNPPVSSPPLPQARPNILLPGVFGAVSVPLPPGGPTPTPVQFFGGGQNPNPTYSAMDAMMFGFSTAIPLSPIFVQMNLPQVPAGVPNPLTFDTSYGTLGAANTVVGGQQYTGPVFIAAPGVGGPPRPSPLNPFRIPLNNEVFGIPQASLPNVFDPQRTANVGGRSPGNDAIVIVPTNSRIFPTVNVLLADELSPGGITLPAGTVLRADEFGMAAIPLLNNGQVGSTFLIYDSGYSADYHSNVWGTEAKVVLDIGPDHNGMKLKPVVGFRYMSVDEQFRQVGLSTVPTTGPTLQLSQAGQTAVVVGEPVRASIIDSTTQNSLYGLQVGASAEYNNQYFSLGVEPRISLGVNQYEAEVTTSSLRSIFDPQRTTTESSLDFAPVFDVNMYGQIHVTPYFTLHAGYNFTYLFQVTRPADNIYYNNTGSVGQSLPGVVVDATTRDMHIQGLTVGGEFRFRDLKFR